MVSHGQCVVLKCNAIYAQCLKLFADEALPWPRPGSRLDPRHNRARRPWKIGRAGEEDRLITGHEQHTVRLIRRMVASRKAREVASVRRMANEDRSCLQVGHHGPESIEAI